MKKVMRVWMILVIVIGAIPQIIWGESLTASQIIAKVDENHQYRSAYIEARMDITIGARTVTKNMRMWAEGNQKGLVEYTNKRDLGNRILKIQDDLWLYSPMAESEIKLSGDMLKQGMGGSDFSYKDILENAHLKDYYNMDVTSSEVIDGRNCYVLELVAKKDAEVSYYRRKMWIDQERLVELKEELYAPSGKLLKVSRVEKVGQFGERFYPTVSIMEDKLRKNSNTKFVIEKIQFDVAIPVGTFTRQRLTGK